MRTSRRRWHSGWRCDWYLSVLGLNLHKWSMKILERGCWCKRMQVKARRCVCVCAWVSGWANVCMCVGVDLGWWGLLRMRMSMCVRVGVLVCVCVSEREWVLCWWCVSVCKCVRACGWVCANVLDVCVCVSEWAWVLLGVGVCLCEWCVCVSEREREREISFDRSGEKVHSELMTQTEKSLNQMELHFLAEEENQLNRSGSIRSRRSWSWKRAKAFFCRIANWKKPMDTHLSGKHFPRKFLMILHRVCNVRSAYYPKLG